MQLDLGQSLGRIILGGAVVRDVTHLAAVETLVDREVLGLVCCRQILANFVIRWLVLLRDFNA
jgi:hypothetical protein